MFLLPARSLPLVCRVVLAHLGCPERTFEVASRFLLFGLSVAAHWQPLPIDTGVQAGRQAALALGPQAPHPLRRHGLVFVQGLLPRGQSTGQTSPWKVRKGTQYGHSEF